MHGPQGSMLEAPSFQVYVIDYQLQNNPSFLLQMFISV